MQYDPNGNPPCYSSEDQVIENEDQHTMMHDIDKSDMFVDYTEGCAGSDKAGGHAYGCYRDCKYGGCYFLFEFDPSD